MNPKTKYIIIAFALLLGVFSVYTWRSNTALEVTVYEIRSDRIPEPFSGYRIAQISDLHNAEFGEGNCKLIEQLYQTVPDLIVLTGDLIDSRDTNIQIALGFAAEAVKIAPVCFVPGNHEARISEYDHLKVGLAEAGVTILENEQIRISREGESLTFLGVTDPSFETDYLFGDSAQVMACQLDSFEHEPDGYRILLSHRPELFDAYVSAGMDLVFSGHAHGGQIRLPFLGGLVAPNQGFFPEYDAGIFTQGDTNMIVSRGVGNSIIPLRVNNRPEIVLVELICPQYPGG